MSTVAEGRITPEEYLEREQTAEYKSEYFDGEVFPMLGASREHVLLTRNTLVALHLRLREKSCQTYSSDMRVRVDATGLYTYPDVSVTCGEEHFVLAGPNTLLNPVLIVEVLSKSTKDYDRGGKFVNYRSIPSLWEYVMIEQDSVHVEQYQRQALGQWLLTEYTDRSSSIRLPPLGIELPIAEIYEGVLSPRRN